MKPSAVFLVVAVVFTMAVIALLQAKPDTFRCLSTAWTSPGKCLGYSNMRASEKTGAGLSSRKLGQQGRQLSHAAGTSNNVDSGSTLQYGFQWINTTATITVDLNMNNSYVATFLELLYYTQSKRLQITCPKSERFGKSEIQSGWYVCVAEPFNLVKPCLVYSFGMGPPSLWSFDEVVTKKYGCQDMAYDPSTGRRTSKVGERIWFFNVGLSGKDGTLKKKWAVKTLETLLKENKHIDTTIDILKIDIECSEWSAFDAILASPKCLENVKQLLVEFHPCGFRGAKTPQEDFLGYWRTLRAIDRLGFKLWRVWNNYACKFPSRRVPGAAFYGCHNAYYLNVNYLV